MGLKSIVETMQSEGAKLTLYTNAPDWRGATVAIAGQVFESAVAGENLLRDAIERAKNLGAVSIIGPMEGDTWHSYRLPTESDGRASFLMEPVCGEHDFAAFKQAGFDIIGGYFSADVRLSEVNSVIPELKDDLLVSAWDGSNAEALFTESHSLSLKAFVNNAFYKPIDLDEFLSLYLPMVPQLDPSLIFQARDKNGELQGFLFGLPNYAEGAKPHSVILKTYASLKRGAGHLLSATFYEAAKTAGYTSAIHALMHDDNLSALRSATNGATVFRRYALMGRCLDSQST